MIDENKKSKLVSELQQLGFSPKETTVYISLLRSGEVGTSKIIQDTGLHGQFVYTALQSLETKGLAFHTLRRGRKKFSAKNPKVLTRQAENQKKIAQSVAIELSELMVLPPEQEYEVYQGEEAFHKLQFELYEECDENSEYLIISGAGEEYLDVVGDDIIRLDRIRTKKQLLIRYLGCTDQEEYLKKSSRRQGLFEYRMLPGLFTGKVNTNIKNDALIFNIFGQPVTCFVIRNSLIAGSYRQFFETLWKLGRK